MPTSLYVLLLVLFGATLILLLFGLLFWPQRGLMGRWQRSQQTTARIQREDALKQIYLAEVEGHRPTVASIAGALYLRRSAVVRLLAHMQAAGLVQFSQDDICLTPRGRQAALHIVRAHRLWEHHLAEETGVDELEWHEQAEIYEHFLSPEATDRLAAHLGNPTHDPHGDPIPKATGEWTAPASQVLTSVAGGQTVRITQLEDEPTAVYAQLVAEGLHPGMIVRVGDANGHQVRFWSSAGEHVLAPIIAANVFVTPIRGEEPPTPHLVPTLADLALGESTEVTRLSPRCRGIERRRLMDLGIVPGTRITAELASAGGGLTAYRIRGALIALRREQAALIQVQTPAQNKSVH